MAFAIKYAIYKIIKSWKRFEQKKLYCLIQWSFHFSNRNSCFWWIQLITRAMLYIILVSIRIRFNWIISEHTFMIMQPTCTIIINVNHNIHYWYKCSEIVQRTFDSHKMQYIGLGIDGNGCFWSCTHNIQYLCASMNIRQQHWIDY